MAQNFCGSSFLQIGDFMCFAGTKEGFSCWELIFAIFRKYPVPSIDNKFVFIEYMQQKYIFLNNKPVFLWIPFCFWVKETSCDWTDTVSNTVFLCSEFRLENIYSAVNFCGKMFEVIFICRNLFSGLLEKSKKIRTGKNFMPHGRLWHDIV